MTAFTRALRRTPVRRAAAAAALTAGALLLAACGSGNDTSASHHGGTGPSATADAGPGAGSSAPADSFNDADVRFAQLMIPHHEQALEMSRLADGRAADAEIEDLARKIEQAQDPEIRTMKGWLTAWGRPTAAPSEPGTDHGGGHGGGHGGDGMMSAADMTELKALKGEAFDKAFAQLMIDHHNGAITMAEDERREGENPDAKKLAGAIVKGQSAEVEQLRGILDRL
ncbi:DUF305 domain-containing protein [Streptomyces dubilierae]|uniref:DUF305 domain-containing protein n=1 Tax=Streptomyces dubilierae TaxID=3075533 RepID=A0ABU2PE21_9ACTN|nr:DUF305 domain-containing protein [Streptomyces sp. DSM 41921]MDT0389025.1 DUF305 domain-containing protein [Streptomyces sp. DSM 41921]